MCQTRSWFLTNKKLRWQYYCIRQTGWCYVIWPRNARMDFLKVSGQKCCPCNELCCAIKLDTFGSAAIDRRAARAPDASMIQCIRPAFATGCNDDWSGDRINTSFWHWWPFTITEVYACDMRGVLCLNQLSRTGTSNYPPHIFRDVIICPCHWCLLLTKHSSCMKLNCYPQSRRGIPQSHIGHFLRH